RASGKKSDRSPQIRRPKVLPGRAGQRLKSLSDATGGVLPAPGIMEPATRVSFSRRFEGVNKIGGLVFGRPNDDPVLEIGHLSEVIAGDVLPLRNNHARLCPFTILSDFYLAGNGVKGLRSDVIRNLRMIEALVPSTAVANTWPAA